MRKEFELINIILRNVLILNFTFSLCTIYDINGRSDQFFSHQHVKNSMFKLLVGNEKEESESECSSRNNMQ